MRCCFLLGKVVTARAQLASTRSSCNLLTANRLRVPRPSFSSRLLPGLTQPVTLCELFSRCTLISWNPEDGDSDAFPPLWGVLRSLDEMCHVNFNQGLHSESESWYSWTVWKENVNWGREVAHQKWTRGKSQPTQDFLGRKVCMHANRKQEHSLCFPGNCLINNGWLNCIAAIQPLQTIFFHFSLEGIQIMKADVPLLTPLPALQNRSGWSLRSSNGHNSQKNQAQPLLHWREVLHWCWSPWMCWKPISDLRYVIM